MSTVDKMLRRYLESAQDFQRAGFEATEDRDKFPLWERAALAGMCAFLLTSLKAASPGTAHFVATAMEAADHDGQDLAVWVNDRLTVLNDPSATGADQAWLFEPARDEATCHRCGGPNLPWSAPSPLWNQVMRGGDINGGPEPHDGIVCPTCFAVLAEGAGVADLWRLYPQRVHVPLQTVTPSGRVWNEQTWMFDEPAEQ